MTFDINNIEHWDYATLCAIEQMSGLLERDKQGSPKGLKGRLPLPWPELFGREAVEIRNTLRSTIYRPGVKPLGTDRPTDQAYIEELVRAGFSGW